jgi:hypothetical protein
MHSSLNSAVWDGKRPKKDHRTVDTEPPDLQVTAKSSPLRVCAKREGGTIAVTLLKERTRNPLSRWLLTTRRGALPHTAPQKALCESLGRLVILHPLLSFRNPRPASTVTSLLLLLSRPRSICYARITYKIANKP